MSAANTAESILTPANVNASTFGKIWDNEQILGQVYAQPLYLPNLSMTINGQTETQNTLLVATEANMLYWINADSGKTLYAVDFDNYGIAGATAVTPVPSQDVGEGSLTGTATTNTQIYPQMGITTARRYLKTASCMSWPTKKRPPRDKRWLIMCLISKSSMLAPGSSNSNSSPTPALTAPITPISRATRSCRALAPAQSMIPYTSTPKQQGNRPEVTMVTDTAGNQDLLLAFEGHDDVNPYHGWEIAVNASTLDVVGAFCSTPNGSEAGIWRAPITDAKGHIWIVTGNGTFDTQLNQAGQPANGDYGDSVVRLELTPSGFNVADYFTPSNQQALSDNDLDLDAGGLTQIPDAAGNLTGLVSIGKDGTIYLLDPFNLGGFAAGGDHVREELPNVIPAVAPARRPCFVKQPFSITRYSSSAPVIAAKRSPIPPTAPPRWRLRRHRLRRAPIVFPARCRSFPPTAIAIRSCGRLTAPAV